MTDGLVLIAENLCFHSIIHRSSGEGIYRTMGILCVTDSV
jgi:hypothetical protein